MKLLGPLLRALGVSVALAACSDGNDVTFIEERRFSSPPPEQRLQDEFFALDHLVEIEIEIAPADWDVLRHEGRNIVGVFTRSQADYEYTYFDSTVTIDGQRYENVAVRKKGFWGSLSTVRPSLKLNLGRGAADGRHLGLKRFTLNNDRTEPTHTHACMTYRLFARAGLPAPRCNLAHVVVNGQDLGTYTHVETIDDDMLERSFGDASGNLYEGQLADFIAADVDYMQLDNREERNDRSDLFELVAALEAPDEELITRLEAILDLDRFRDFWAMETLTEHWDGYAYNANNYLTYHDPQSDRFVFIPWGADGALDGGRSLRAFGAGRIANRLYRIPAELERYRQRLGELNDALWDVDTLLGEVDQIAALTSSPRTDALERQRAIIRRWGDVVRRDLQRPAPRLRARGSPCLGQVNPVEGRFDTVWGSIESMSPGAGSFDASVSIDGQPRTAEWSGGAGVDIRRGSDSRPIIRFVGALPGGDKIQLDVIIESNSFKPGVVEFHGAETSGEVYAGQGKRPVFVGGLGLGSIEFTQARAAANAPVTGSFRGHLVQLGCSGS